MMGSPTHESAGLDELDLALVNALQIYPRAPWTLLGPVLGLDPATLTRRWARLTSTGHAWVTTTATHAYVNETCTAVVEINCAPGQSLHMATAVAHDSNTLMVDRLAGDRDLLLVVFTDDLPAMDHYLTDRLGRLPGVQRIASHIMTGYFTETGSWRLDALGPEQCARIEAAHPHPHRQPAEPDTRDRELVQLLHADGRRSYADLADHLGVSPATARTRLHRLQATGHLALQCDFARPLVGWPVTAVYWASVPTSHTAETGRALARFPETRFCLTVAGPHNIIFAAYLHSIADSDRFEAELSARLPQLAIGDRAIALHTVKAYSRLLDPQGRCIGAIPPSAWPNPSTVDS
ncbi:Lrp/AsnC family transcriptional regulator [Nocardia sp. NPDC051570]|uniref:Lrp/AsnC family transcriptional regulator n=1 Tax=Nocardia sp. NPDC051570 TaxID=3364324 RepID=UPI00378EE2A4